jgi:hypothetical protein
MGAVGEILNNEKQAVLSQKGYVSIQLRILTNKEAGFLSLSLSLLAFQGKIISKFQGQFTKKYINTNNQSCTKPAYCNICFFQIARCSVNVVVLVYLISRRTIFVNSFNSDNHKFKKIFLVIV